MYVGTNAQIHASMCKHIKRHVDVREHVHVHTHRHVHIQIHRYKYIYTHMHKHIPRAFTYTYIVCAYTHKYAQVCMHIHIWIVPQMVGVACRTRAPQLKIYGSRGFLPQCFGIVTTTLQFRLFVCQPLEDASRKKPPPPPPCTQIVPRQGC